MIGRSVFSILVVVYEMSDLSVISTALDPIQK